MPIMDKTGYIYVLTNIVMGMWNLSIKLYKIIGKECHHGQNCFGQYL